MSWKQYGGIDKIKKANINAVNIAVDDITLRKAYTGNFDIDGSIIVESNAEISGNLIVRGYSTLNDVCMNTLLVNSVALFNGDVSMNQALHANNITSNTIATSGNVTVGSQLYLNTPHYFYGDLSGIGLDTMKPTATLDISSNRVAALNVGTTSSINKNILAQNSTKNGVVLGAGLTQSGIDFFTLGDISNALISNGDAHIHANQDGSMELHCLTDTHILSNMVISGNANNAQIQHVSNETMTVYDTSGGYYFDGVYVTNPDYPRIILNPTILGENTAFMSSNPASSSTTMVSLLDTSMCGAAIVGGNYPLYSNRSMLSHGLIDKNGDYMPTETIVGGNPNNTKYLATTGINTYMPRTDKYVLDVNGPVHFDNGDIVNINNTNFEILQMKHAIDPSYNNYVMAIGASIDASGSYVDICGTILGYRYSVIFSANGGSTWNSTILYPTSALNVVPKNAVLSGTYNILNQVDVYDCSYAFITGNAGTLIYTYDGGYTWENISIFITGISSSLTSIFNAVKVKPQTDFYSTNAISVYFSSDISSNPLSYFTTFDVSFSKLNLGNPFNLTLTNYYSSPIHINSIGLGNTKMYTAGEKIVTYNLSDLSVIDFSFNPVNAGVTNYIWSKIDVYSDSYAIAIATGISRGSDGQDEDIQIPTSIISMINNNTITNWNSSDVYFVAEMDYGSDPSEGPLVFYYPMKCIIKDIYIYDTSNSIVIGNCDIIATSEHVGDVVSNHPVGSFILVTYDGGTTWNDMATYLLNASGKMNLLISPQVYPHNIIIVDPNTLLIAYSTIFSELTTPDANKRQYYYVSGASTIYSVFTPNYLNAANNQLIDICGNMSVYGSLYAKNLTYGSISGVSDYRIKTDISLLSDEYSIDDLKPIQYRNMLTGKSEFGFLAHELQEQIPLLVEGEKDATNYQSINYIGIIALLVKEIQNLKKLVKDPK